MKRVIKASKHNNLKPILCTWASSVREGDIILDDDVEFHVVKIHRDKNGVLEFVNNKGESCFYDTSDQVDIV